MIANMITTMKTIAIPQIDKGGRRFERENRQLLERVRQLPAGAAVEVDVPAGKDAHIFRTNKRQALRKLGLKCKTAMLPCGRKFAIWPEESTESL